MNILYHHRTKSRDGQAIHIEELQRALRQRGHEVVEVSPRADEDVPLGGESVRLARLGAALPTSLREVAEWAYNAISYRALVRTIRRRCPDLIYERYALGNIAGLVAAQQFGIPLFLEVNSSLAKERQDFGGLRFPSVARHLETQLLHRADRLFVVSEALRSRFVAAGHPPERLVTSHNAVDLERFDRRLAAEEAKRRLGLSDKLIIGFTGFMREWHRIDQLIEVIARGDGALSRAHLLIVGDSKVSAPLRALAEASGVGNRLTMTGVVAHEDLASYIAAFDVAVQAGSPDCASPLKLFEYMAMAKAIVMPDVAGVREVVTSGAEALLFRQDSRDDLTKAILTLLNDAALRERLGNAAYHRLVAAGHTWDNNAARIEEQWAAVRRCARK